MKKIVLSAILSALTSGGAAGQDRPKLSFGDIKPTPPTVPQTPLQVCSEAADYAATAMELRQMGVPIYELMEVVYADAESGRFSFLRLDNYEWFVTRPYQTELQPTERLAVIAVAEFREDFFFGCMKAQKNG